VDPKQLENVTRWNCVLAALLIVVGAVFFDGAVALGLTVGSLIATANFWGIQRLITRSMSVQGRSRTLLQGLLMVKMLVLMILVFLCIRFLPMSSVAFAIGLSVFLLSIVIESLRFALSDSNREENGRA
jgi:hypothetical protein